MAALVLWVLALLFCLFVGAALGNSAKGRLSAAAGLFTLISFVMLFVGDELGTLVPLLGAGAKMPMPYLGFFVICGAVAIVIAVAVPTAWWRNRHSSARSGRSGRAVHVH